MYGGGGRFDSYGVHFSLVVPSEETMLYKKISEGYVTQTFNDAGGSGV